MRPSVARFFVRFVLPRWKPGVILLSVIILTYALVLPIPLAYRLVIDQLIPQGRVKELAGVAAGLVLAVGLRGGLTYLKQYLKVVIEENLVADVESALVHHLLTLPLAFFHEREVGYLMARVRNDPAVAKGFFFGVLDLLSNLIFLVVGAGLLFWLDWRLALVAVGILPSLGLISRRFNRRLQVLSRDIQEGDALVSKEVEEGLASALTTKLLGLSCWVESKVARTIGFLKRANVRTNTVGARAGGGLTFIVEVTPVLFLSLGAWQIMHGSLSLGTVVAFVSFISYLYGPTQSIITTNLGLQRARVSINRIFELFDETPERPGKVSLTVSAGHVEVDNVSFRYPNATVALRDVSLQVQLGTRVALVGRTGSGKSTLLSLLVGLYEPAQGTIHIDGQDLSNVGLASLRSQVVLITQDVFLFSTSVMENLLAGDRTISDEEVLRVTHALGVHRFISQLPAGYESMVAERGARLSGGQKQLLAVARAMLRKPKILLLDEATSAMDSETEAAVWRALPSLLPGITLIVAAHRLATVESADEIFVLKNSYLVQQGTHNELLEKSAEYREIFEEQLISSSVKG